MALSQTRRNERFRDKVKIWMIEYRKTLSCERCGESHEACIAFHHRDPSEKKYAIAAMPNRGCSIEKIKEEIAKCEVLCHNCHAKLHYEEGFRPCVIRSQIGSSAVESSRLIT